MFIFEKKWSCYCLDDELYAWIPKCAISKEDGNGGKVSKMHEDICGNKILEIGQQWIEGKGNVGMWILNAFQSEKKLAAGNGFLLMFVLLLRQSISHIITLLEVWHSLSLKMMLMTALKWLRWWKFLHLPSILSLQMSDELCNFVYNDASSLWQIWLLKFVKVHLVLNIETWFCFHFK